MADLYQYFLYATFFVLSISQCVLPIATSTAPSTIPTIDLLTNTTRGWLGLTDLGYEGTWKEFCDPQQIEKDFPLYPEHDLKVMRSMLCVLKMGNRIIGDAQVPSVIYKFCVGIRSRLDSFMEQFLSVLSANDDQRRTVLRIPGPNNDTSSSCYRETFAAFTKSCATDGNPCINMFRSLLSRACNVPWLTVADIVSAVRNVCDGKFLSDKIDWEALSN